MLNITKKVRYIVILKGKIMSHHVATNSIKPYRRTST